MVLHRHVSRKWAVCGYEGFLVLVSLLYVGLVQFINRLKYIPVAVATGMYFTSDVQRTVVSALTKNWSSHEIPVLFKVRPLFNCVHTVIDFRTRTKGDSGIPRLV